MGAATAGSGLSIVTTGAYTGADGVLKIVADSATTGTVVNVDAAALTTGTLFAATNLDALTTGTGINVVSNSADDSARDLVHIKNDNAAATSAIPLHLENDALVETNFVIMMELDGNTIFKSDGTTPNGNLTGVQGDLCVGADGGKAYYCSTTGTVWTAL